MPRSRRARPAPPLCRYLLLLLLLLLLLPPPAAAKSLASCRVAAAPLLHCRCPTVTIRDAESLATDRLAAAPPPKGTSRPAVAAATRNLLDPGGSCPFGLVSPVTFRPTSRAPELPSDQAHP